MADWQAGDMALCIGGRGDWMTVEGGVAAPGPKGGFIGTVERARGCSGLTFLHFPEYVTGGFNSKFFRKVTPGAPIDGVEVEKSVPCELVQQ